MLRPAKGGYPEWDVTVPPKGRRLRGTRVWIGAIRVVDYPRATSPAGAQFAHAQGFPESFQPR